MTEYQYLLTFGFLELPYEMLFAAVFITLLILVGILSTYLYVLYSVLDSPANYIAKHCDGSLKGNLFELLFDALMLLILFTVFLIFGHEYILTYGFDSFGQPFNFVDVMAIPLFLFLLGFPILIRLISYVSQSIYVLYYQYQGKSKQWIAIYQMSQRLRRYDWL